MRHTQYCSNDGCETEAVKVVVHENGRRLPLCYTCATAYEWGQASPEAAICEIDDPDLDEDDERVASIYETGEPITYRNALGQPQTAIIEDHGKIDVDDRPILFLSDGHWCYEDDVVQEEKEKGKKET